jgi:hypothetical protein
VVRDWQSSVLFSLARDPPGVFLVINPATGDVTCPARTALNIGPDWGGCCELRGLLAPPCL